MMIGGVLCGLVCEKTLPGQTIHMFASEELAKKHLAKNKLSDGTFWLENQELVRYWQHARMAGTLWVESTAHDGTTVQYPIDTLISANER